VDAALGQGGPLCGPLSLGAIPTVAPYVLPGLLAAARRAHPKLRLVLREARTATLVEELRAGRLDAALLALPVDTPGLSSVPLADDPFLLVAPHGHRPPPMAPCASDLRRPGAAADRTPPARPTGPVRRGRAHDRGRATRCTLLRLVAAGLGVTLLPALARDEATGDACSCALRDPAPGTLGPDQRTSSARAGDFLLLAETLRGALPGGVTAKA
jgi:LysR family hydrogen peroxide-inducible transcriptional activator